jgi:hypothetical protein
MYKISDGCLNILYYLQILYGQILKYRTSGLQNYEPRFMLFVFSLTAQAERAPEHFQKELFNFRYDINLKDKFPATNLRFSFLLL